ncbi:MAG: hypothetical protein LBV34_19510 [Nocardiopsaceae bacterium]|nr:hypothetical protein [Nocardiopsaceae bacterium]
MSELREGQRPVAGRALGGAPKVHVLHENPDWFAPIGAALAEAGIPYEQWLLGEAVLDLDEQPPPGVFWSRMSASSHTRSHPYAKDQTRGVLRWLEAHGRRVVNGRRAIELEMSKVEQLVALRAAGFDVPRTIAVAGAAELAAAARKLPVPFISKHNQGGKGLGVRLFNSHDEFDEYLAEGGYDEPVDGITLLQEYLQAAEPMITRAELVGGEFIYAIAADTSVGGFQLCPADACEVAGGPPKPLFSLREGFDHPVTGRYAEFAGRQGIEIAGFEFIETVDGRLVTYDINTTTNYNAGIEAIAPRPALRAVAAYLGRLLDDEARKAA